MGGIVKAISAVFLCLVGAAFNSTWPMFCKVKSPELIRVVSIGGWEWENVWLVFVFWNLVLNTALCLGTIGPATLVAVYGAVSTKDFVLVSLFSFLWGSGTAGYSLGIQLLGAGLGIALVMSLLVVIGTLLPLIESNPDEADSPAAIVTILGLILAISGFVASAISSRMKDRALKGRALKVQSWAGAEANDCHLSLEDMGKVASVTKCSDRRMEVGMEEGDVGDASGPPVKSQGNGNKSADDPSHKGTGGDARPNGDLEVPKWVPAEEVHTALKARRQRGHHVLGVIVCVFAAVMSSMLQFSFVFAGSEEKTTITSCGEPLVEYAEEDKGVPSIAAPLVVWFLAFSFSNVFNLIYACFLLTKNRTWGRFATTSGLKALCKSVQVFLMSFMFLGHIYLYGVAQDFFGDLGPVIAWPLLMCSTVLGGQLWSVFMRDWEGVPKAAVKMNVLSIVLIMIAVCLIAVAGAVL